MQNPFDNPEETATVAPTTVPVINSQLFCEACFHENSEGLYDNANSLLTFVCTACGHENRVGIEL